MSFGGDVVDVTIILGMVCDSYIFSRT